MAGPERVTRGAAIAYAAMLAAAVLAFAGVRALGDRLAAPAGAGFGQANRPHAPEALLHLLLALLVVIAVSRAMGALFRHIHQPPVMGEVLAGIVLGPSVLGRALPEVGDYLLPASLAPSLGAVAQIGVILFMFLVGLELDPSTLRNKPQATLAISHASIVLPFVLGSAISLWLYPKLSSADVPFGVFALFMGVSMSVTAFPVLARILKDSGIHKTRLGVLALGCAAVDDVTAWCLLAFVVSVAKAHVEDAVTTIALAAAYVAGMLLVVRPLVVRALAGPGLTGRTGRGATALALIGLLASSLATEFIGIHALFGAFLLGAIIPHDSPLAGELARKLEDLVVVLLLPAFFAFTGMRTQLGLVHGAEQWLMCAAIIAVACAGKFGGSALAGRLAGLGWRDAASIGVLMNTRGLMELIVLNVGLDLGVISPPLFAMMVTMAVVTTFATAPALKLLSREGDLAEAELSPAGDG